MTPQEEIFVVRCEQILEDIRQRYAKYPGQTAICINALREQIDKIKDVPGARTELDMKNGIMIGLTFDDMRHLYNGGTLTIDTGTPELSNIRITILLGGTHEHMAKGMEKHPGTPHKFTDTHGDTKN